MKSILIYTVGTLLFFPCMFAALDDILGALIAIVWGVLLWYSPKFCRPIRKFWLVFWKVNYRILAKFGDVD